MKTMMAMIALTMSAPAMAQAPSSLVTPEQYQASTDCFVKSTEGKGFSPSLWDTETARCDGEAKLVRNGRGPVEFMTECLTTRALELGAKNSEPADTIVKASMPRCEGWLPMVESLALGHQFVERSAGVAVNLQEQTEKYLDQAKDRATAALIEARNAH